MDNKKKNFRILAISLVLCLISMIGASGVQTSGGRVEIKDLHWETPYWTDWIYNVHCKFH